MAQFQRNSSSRPRPTGRINKPGAEDRLAAPRLATELTAGGFLPGGSPRERQRRRQADGEEAGGNGAQPRPHRRRWTPGLMWRAVVFSLGGDGGGRSPKVLD